jgi:glycosyltransferase involved in cell wall biosynthesis
MVDKLLSINPNEQIIILDNGSSYAPLLSWYKEVLVNPKYKTVRVQFEKNEGHLALWSTGLDKQLGEYFIYTDADIELNKDLPLDWKEIMFNTMQQYQERKIALGIRLDDIPDYYRFKNQVLRNEARWWLDSNKVDENAYRADTDTTFALYKNFHDNCYKSIRLTRKDLLCRHMGWYLDLNSLDEEEKYYLENLGERVTTQYSKQNKEPEKYTDI